MVSFRELEVLGTDSRDPKTGLGVCVVEEKAPSQDWGRRDLLDGFPGEPDPLSWCEKAKRTLGGAALPHPVAAADAVIWLVRPSAGATRVTEFAARKDDVLAWQPGQDLPLLYVDGPRPDSIEHLPRARHPVWARVRAAGLPFNARDIAGVHYPADRLLLTRKAAALLQGGDTAGGRVRQKLQDAGLDTVSSETAETLLGAKPKDKRYDYCVVGDLEDAYSAEYSTGPHRLHAERDRHTEPTVGPLCHPVYVPYSTASTSSHEIDLEIVTV